MKIKFLFTVIMINVVLLLACKKKSEDSTPADTTPPVITLNGSSTVSLALSSPYSDAGATATDNIDGTVSVSSNVSASNPNVNANGVYTITYTATDKAGNVAHSTRTVSVGFSRADYLWSNGNGYSAVDSDVTQPSNSSTFTGCKILAGAGANDIQIACFWYSTQSLYATVNGATVTITGTQTFYPSKLSGSGTMNSAKNKITLNIHDANDNHDHVVTLTKL